MTAEALLVPAPSNGFDGRALVSAFLAGRSPRTLRAYAGDLEDFAAFLDAETPGDAARTLLGNGHGRANALALAYRAHLLDRGLSPATVNRRLAAVRSLVKLARTLGVVAWTLEVPSVASVPYRDTRGPGRDGFRRLRAELDGDERPKAVRDRAILHLLHDLALRRGEVVGLDLAHVDLENGTLSIQGKGRTERERLTLPAPTRAALAAWIATRGEEPGPLFVNFDRATKGRRLTGRSVARILNALGARAGLGAVRPHGLRHAAITSALDVTGGDVRAVQRYSRHRDVRVLQRYDDNREDLGGRVAILVAAA